MRLNQRNLDHFKKVHQEMNNPERVYDYLNSGWSLVDIRLEDGEDQGEGTQRTIYTLDGTRATTAFRKQKARTRNCMQRLTTYPKNIWKDKCRLTE
jgi:hypothetical protein